METTIAIINADIKTMDGIGAGCDALAISHERIARLGSTDEILVNCNEDTRVIDAEGATVIPGFVESHMHMFVGAHSFGTLPLHGVTGTRKITECIREFASKHPDEPLLIAQGLSYQAFDGGRDANRHLLDAICPNQPLLLQSADFHNGWANTAALNASGIFFGYDVGPGAHIEMEDEGTASGVLTEPPAVAMVQALGRHGGREVSGLKGVEPTGEVSDEQRENDLALLREGLAYCAQHGITTIINMDGNQYQAELLKKLEMQGQLTSRVALPYHIIPGKGDECVEIAEQMRNSLNSDMLWCTHVKFFMDGVLDMGTAFRIQGYPGKADYKSSPLHEPSRFAELATEFDKRGFQIAVHAIGDGAVRTVLDGYEAAQKTNNSFNNRHRVEHIELLDPADLQRFSELHAVASMMPPHPPGCGDFPLEPLITIIGKDQWKDAYCWRSLKEAGAHVCFSSDWPIAELSPLAGINIAMTRKKWSAELKDERLSFDETLSAYTADGAYACRREDQFGSLKAGLLADVVILDRKISPENCAETNVSITICNGEITYQA